MTVESILRELVAEFGEPTTEAEAMAFARYAYGAGWRDGHHALADARISTEVECADPPSESAA